MAILYPIEIHHDRAMKTVRVTWNDGHIGLYEQAYLRGYCPCALCQGHGAQIRFIDAPPAELVEIRPVGNYAIEIFWQDGHSTGIYTFEYLRALCPCTECSTR